MRTYNNVMPFLHNPFQPTLLSSAPFPDIRYTKYNFYKKRICK
jgi:hypothetical protein